MRGVDHRGVALLNEVLREPFDPSEPAGADLADGQGRGADPTGEARDDADTPVRQPAGEGARLTGAPEDENAHAHSPTRERRLSVAIPTAIPTAMPSAPV